MLETRRGSRDWNNIKGQRRPLCLVSSRFIMNGSSCSHPSTISFQRSLIRLLEENKVRRREKVGGQGRNNETSRSQIHWRSPVYDLARQHSLGKKV